MAFYGLYALRRTPMIHTAETMIPAKPDMRLLNSNENHNFARTTIFLTENETNPA